MEKSTNFDEKDLSSREKRKLEREKNISNFEKMKNVIYVCPRTYKETNFGTLVKEISKILNKQKLGKKDKGNLEKYTNAFNNAVNSLRVSIRNGSNEENNWKFYNSVTLTLEETFTYNSTHNIIIPFGSKCDDRGNIVQLKESSTVILRKSKVDIAGNDIEQGENINCSVKGRVIIDSEGLPVKRGQNFNEFFGEIGNPDHERALSFMISCTTSTIQGPSSERVLTCELGKLVRTDKSYCIDLHLFSLRNLCIEQAIKILRNGNHSMALTFFRIGDLFYKVNLVTQIHDGSYVRIENCDKHLLSCIGVKGRGVNPNRNFLGMYKFIELRKHIFDFVKSKLKEDNNKPDEEMTIFATTKSCPFCENEMIISKPRDGGILTGKFRCFSCNSAFCLNCDEKFDKEHDEHCGIGDEEARNEREISNVSKKCPTCDSNVQYVGGCYHMTCMNPKKCEDEGCQHDGDCPRARNEICGAHWCWLCKHQETRTDDIGNVFWNGCPNRSCVAFEQVGFGPEDLR